MKDSEIGDAADLPVAMAEDAPLSVSSKPEKLTAANLKAHSVASKQSAAKKSVKSAKPAWARTEA